MFNGYFLQGVFERIKFSRSLDFALILNSCSIFKFPEKFNMEE